LSKPFVLGATLEILEISDSFPSSVAADAGAGKVMIDWTDRNQMGEGTSIKDQIERTRLTSRLLGQIKAYFADPKEPLDKPYNSSDQSSLAGYKGYVADILKNEIAKEEKYYNMLKRTIIRVSKLWLYMIPIPKIRLHFRAYRKVE
jgi:hypothetical protein